MNMALYGAGQKSVAAAGILREQCPDIRVGHAVEGRVFQKIGQKLPCADGTNLDVISLQMLADLYRKKDIHAVAIPSTYHPYDVREAIELCGSHDIKKEDIFLIPFNAFFDKKQCVERGGGVSPLVGIQDFVQLHDLNIHVTEHCNLNCKACCHFSSLVEKEFFYDTTEFSSDIRKLSEVIPNIERIALLGGEPLLHKNIDYFFEVVRQYYPYAEIGMATNGILLTSISDKIIKSIKSNNVKISISLYPAMKKKIDAIAAFLHANNISFGVQRFDKFFRMLRPEPVFNKHDTHRRCDCCQALRGGRLFKCILAAYTDSFNKRFGDIFPVDSGIDVHGGLSGPDMMRLLAKPLDMCAYCIGKGFHLDPWEPTDAPKPEDWYLPLSMAAQRAPG